MHRLHNWQCAEDFSFEKEVSSWTLVAADKELSARIVILTIVLECLTFFYFKITRSYIGRRYENWGGKFDKYRLEVRSNKQLPILTNFYYFEFEGKTWEKIKGKCYIIGHQTYEELKRKIILPLNLLFATISWSSRLEKVDRCMNCYKS